MMFKRNVKKRPGVLAKERAQKQDQILISKHKRELKRSLQDKILNSKQMSLCISVLLSRVLEKRPGTLEKKRAEKQLARQDLNFKANELVHQRYSKQSARKRPGTLGKERTKKNNWQDEILISKHEKELKRS